MWDMTRVPCSCAISMWLKHDAKDFVNTFFKRQLYTKAYKGGNNAMLSVDSLAKERLPIRSSNYKSLS